MPWGLLASCRSENLGDEMQAIAAASFLPRVDALVDRDHLGMTRTPHTRVVFNGWFLLGEQWPPPETIEPLMVSFYATPDHPHVLGREHLAWYRTHGPIGCRSHGMAKRARDLGIDAFFSGCLTLALPERTVPATGKTLLVDCDRELLRRLVPARVIERAEFRTHVERSDAGSVGTRLARRALVHGGRHAPATTWRLFRRFRAQRHAERMHRAEALLDAYAGAALVITSRLHCYLPCLALGTPVILLDTGADADRLSGLAELGRAYGPSHARIDLDWEHPEPNPGRHLPLAGDLARAVRAWVAGVR